jgi:hypothetical protein
MSADKLAQALKNELMRRKVTSLPLKIRLMESLGLRSIREASAWMVATAQEFESAAQEFIAAHQAQQAEPVAWVDERAIGWLEGRGKTASITTQLQAHKSPERPMPLYAAPLHAKAQQVQQAQAPGWQLARVSDGDIRVYGPDKETWLIRKDCGEGFYDFIHRYFDAAIGAAPQGDKT